MWLISVTPTGLCSLFQQALRLLAFGQLYKVLNMDPLPACKPAPRLLEGVWSVTCVRCDCSFCLLFPCSEDVCVCMCVCILCGVTGDGCVFALCRQLSEEVSGGCGLGRQRLYQTDERWLWPPTLLFQRITAGSDNLNPPSPLLNCRGLILYQHTLLVVCCFRFKFFFSTKYLPVPVRSAADSRHVFSQCVDGVIGLGISTVGKRRTCSITAETSAFRSACFCTVVLRKLLQKQNGFISPPPKKNIKTVATVWSSKENYSRNAVRMPACVFVVITAVNAVNTHSQPLSFDAMLSFLSFICSERWTVEEKRSWTEVAEVKVIHLFEEKKKPSSCYVDLNPQAAK